MCWTWVGLGRGREGEEEGEAANVLEKGGRFDSQGVALVSDDDEVVVVVVVAAAVFVCIVGLVADVLDADSGFINKECSLALALASSCDESKPLGYWS